MKHALLLSSLLALSLGATADDGRYGRDSDRYADRCPNCGVVDRIDTRYGERRSSGGGAVAGALIGAALGNQVGGGDGRKAATVAGAIAGGVAGNRIEKSRNARDDYAVYVRMDNGRYVVVKQRSLDGLHEGARVTVRGGRARLR